MWAEAGAEFEATRFELEGGLLDVGQYIHTIFYKVIRRARWELAQKLSQMMGGFCLK
jgi:hypothetical protein